jgi:GH18 family chitinase
MKRIPILIVAIFAFNSIASAQSFRVLGYLFSRNNWNTAIDSIDLTKYTDINLAFINPDSAGNFTPSEDFGKVTTKVHQHHARVFASIAGGNPPAYFTSLLADANRAHFIAGLTAFAVQYNFDGVDVDIENDLIDGNYAAFVKELSVALSAKGKLMTSAQAVWNGHKIGDSTFQRFDFINIMSYDKTGPWTPSKPGQHSPYAMATDDFNYFHKTRHIAAVKLFVGLPFYGYGFGKGAPESMFYGDIVKAYPGAFEKDSIIVPEGGKIYYNGIPTIKKKVAFAKKNGAGGVMIWEIQQDSGDERSLLKAIHE